MALYLGSNEITKAYLGSNEVQLYQGSTNLFPPAYPSWMSNFNIIYSANFSSDFTDLSGNNNDGTINTIGSGGASSLTHVDGATPYWDFATTDGNSEQKWVDTSVSPGSLLTSTPWTLFYLYQKKESGKGIVPWDCRDAGTDALNSGVSRTNNKSYANIRNGIQSNLSGTSSLSNYTWYFSMVTSDGINTNKFYHNNTVEDTGTSIDLDLLSNITIGREILNTTFALANFNLAAWGWAKGHYSDATEATEIYDYYDAIYSL